MTKYDPLAKAIVDAYGDVDVAFETTDFPEWKLADWQNAAKVAREFIAAEDDDWVEVTRTDQIHKGDEVRVILDEDGLKITTTGVAHHRDRDGDWAVEQGGVMTNVYDSDQTIYVRRKKQEPPTAPFIIAYKLGGRDEYPNGIPMVRIPSGTCEGLYSSPEHITTVLWSPTDIHRYVVAKAVVDG